MSKRLSYPRRALRLTFREFVSEHRRPLAVMVGAYVGSMALARLLGAHGYWHGFAAGAELVLILATIGLLFLLHTEGIQQLAGARGESMTQQQLATARKRGYVWDAVHNIELERGDIDSIVLAPHGVLAIETRWKFRNVDRRFLQHDLDDAASAASRTRSILRSKGIGRLYDVTPLVVVWGKGGRYVEAGGEQHGAVHLVDGPDLVQWLTAWQHGELDRDTAVDTADALRRFAETRGPQRVGA